jgi:hypothetical protein
MSSLSNSSEFFQSCFTPLSSLSEIRSLSCKRCIHVWGEFQVSWRGWSPSPSDSSYEESSSHSRLGDKGGILVKLSSSSPLCPKFGSSWWVKVGANASRKTDQKCRLGSPIFWPGYTSPTGRHKKLPAARARHATSFMLRGHDVFTYLQYTATHADPDHKLSDCVQSTIIL